MKIETIGDQVIVSITCPKCEKVFQNVVKLGDWLDFLNEKKLMQNCFPYLNVNDRELFMSGMCGKCFDDLYREVE